MKNVMIALLAIFCVSAVLSARLITSSIQPTIVPLRQNLVVENAKEEAEEEFTAKNFSKYFSDKKDLYNFCLYIKSQNYNDGDATWITIQVMLNRLDHFQCDWNTYFNSPEINRSNSIRLIKTGKYKKKFQPEHKKHDQILLGNVLKVLDEEAPIKVPSKVLYFEACAQSPNKCVHKLKNLWKEVKRYRTVKKPGKKPELASITRYYFHPKHKA